MPCNVAQCRRCRPRIIGGRAASSEPRGYSTRSREASSPARGHRLSQKKFSFLQADDVTVPTLGSAAGPHPLITGPAGHGADAAGGGTVATSCTHLEKFHPGGAAAAARRQGDDDAVMQCQVTLHGRGWHCNLYGVLRCLSLSGRWGLSLSRLRLEEVGKK